MSTSFTTINKQQLQCILTVSSVTPKIHVMTMYSSRLIALLIAPRRRSRWYQYTVSTLIACICADDYCDLALHPASSMCVVVAPSRLHDFSTSRLLDFSETAHEQGLAHLCSRVQTQRLAHMVVRCVLHASILCLTWSSRSFWWWRTAESSSHPVTSA